MLGLRPSRLLFPSFSFLGDNNMFRWPLSVPERLLLGVGVGAEVGAEVGDVRLVLSRVRELHITSSLLFET